MRNLVLLLSIYLLYLPVTQAQAISTNTLEGTECKALLLHQGQLYAGAQSVFRWTQTGWQEAGQGLKGQNQFVLDLKGQGDYLVAQTWSGLFVSHMDSLRWRQMTEASHRDLLIQNKQGLYLLSRRGLSRFDEMNGSFEPLLPPPAKGSLFTAVELPKIGWLGVTWSAGLLRYDTITTSWQELEVLKREEGKLYAKGDTVFYSTPFSLRYALQSDLTNWQAYAKDAIRLDMPGHEGIWRTISGEIRPGYLIQARVGQVKAATLPNQSTIYRVCRYEDSWFAASGTGIWVLRPPYTDWQLANTGLHAGAVWLAAQQRADGIVSLQRGEHQVRATHDAGKSWIDLHATQGLPTSKPLAFQSAYGQFHLFLAGGYYTYDQKRQRLREELVADMTDALLVAETGTLLVAVYGHLLRRARDQDGWDTVYTSAADFHEIVSLQNWNGQLLACDHSDKLLRSDDDGQTWQVIRQEERTTYQLLVFGEQILWCNIYDKTCQASSDLSHWEPVSLPGARTTVVETFVAGLRIKLSQQGSASVQYSLGSSWVEMTDWEPGIKRVLAQEDALLLIYDDKLVSTGIPEPGY